MYRSILVPLDGSVFGENALPLALSIARRAGATLHLAHVHDFPVGSIEVFDGALDEEIREGERTYLDDVSKRIAEVSPVPVKTRLLDGAIVEAVPKYAESVHADLAVMTTHGRGPLARFWLGSIADQLVRRLPMPLLLVRPGEGPPDLAEDRAISRILVPLDGSPFAEKILDPATELGTLMGADYTLMQVTRELIPVSAELLPVGAVGEGKSLVHRLEEYHEQERKATRSYLEGVAGKLRARSLNVFTRAVSHGSPAPTILEEARARAYDLIALETHGRGGLSRVMLGSVADKVLRGADVPVLLHRPVE